MSKLGALMTKAACRFLEEEAAQRRDWAAAIYWLERGREAGRDERKSEEGRR